MAFFTHFLRSFLYLIKELKPKLKFVVRALEKEHCIILVAQKQLIVANYILVYGAGHGSSLSKLLIISSDLHY